MMEHRVRQEIHEQFMERVRQACKFIKYLNASSGTIGFIAIIAVFQAANCAFILLSDDEITYPEAGVMTSRLILFGFLALYPFYKVAGLNSAIRELHDIGLATEIPPQVFKDILKVKKMLIIPKVKKILSEDQMKVFPLL